MKQCQTTGTDTSTMNSNSKEARNTHHKLDADETRLLGTFLTTLSEKSMKMEIRRGGGFERICGSLLTSITILSAVYLTPAASLFDYFGNGSSLHTLEQILLAWFYLLALAPLSIALLLATISLHSQKVSVFGSPDMQQAYVEGIKEALETGSCDERLDEYAVARSYSSALNEHYTSLRDKNDKILKRLKAAMVLVMISISVALAGGFLLFVRFA